MHGDNIDKKQEQLESAERLIELTPETTLKRFGIRQNSVICDIGAGTGVFAIPAAKLTEATVYALDIDSEMLERLAVNAKTENITNIESILVEDDNLAVSDDIVDITLMVAVLHEIENKQAFLSEIKRFCAAKAKVAVIDFFPYQTPEGPPLEERLAKEVVKDLFDAIGFSLVDQFDMSENLYCLVFAAK